MTSESNGFTHFIVTWDGMWGKGDSIEDAQRKRLPHFLANEKLPKMPKDAMVWRCTKDAYIDGDGILKWTKEDKRPVRVNPKTLQEI